jgi:hypothetical protein
MRAQTYLQAARPAKFPRRSLDSPVDFSSDTSTTRRVALLMGRVIAMMALLLLPLGQGELSAQQTPLGESHGDLHIAQQAPDQQSGYGQQPYAQQPDPASGEVYPQQGDGQVQPPAEPLNAGQLEQLVAPIALYPDTLVAQVLAASTYPAQVADAAQWRLAQGYASPDQIATGADAQNWDPSVKALTAFPQVLAQMDRNLPWTTDLGNAYYNQPQDVLQAVQVLRRRAQAAGNLQSTPRETVSYDQDNIELAPANPQVVYVPTYDPWTVYGEPVSPCPGFSLLSALGSLFGSSFGSPFGSSAVSYGLGIAMSAFSHTPWGWLAWGLNWLSQSVLFHDSNYYSNSTTVADWGFPHGGAHGIAGRGANDGLPNMPNRTLGSYRPSRGGSNPTLGRGFVPRPLLSYSRPGSGRSATLGQGFVPRPPSSYGRSDNGYDATPGRGFVPRPPAKYAVNRAGESSSRLAYSGGRAGYESRSSAYRSPQRAYHAPKSAFQRANFRSQASKVPQAGGFARFPGKPPKSFRGSGHAPKFSGGKSFGGKHSGGGSHSGRHGGGGHRL